MMKPVFLGKYLLAACWYAAFPAAEAGAGTAQLHPASGDSLPSLCRVLDRGPVLYRDDSSWIRRVKLTLILRLTDRKKPEDAAADAPAEKEQ